MSKRFDKDCLVIKRKVHCSFSVPKRGELSSKSIPKKVKKSREDHENRKMVSISGESKDESDEWESTFDSASIEQMRDTDVNDSFTLYNPLLTEPTFLKNVQLDASNREKDFMPPSASTPKKKQKNSKNEIAFSKISRLNTVDSDNLSSENYELNHVPSSAPMKTFERQCRVIKPKNINKIHHKQKEIFTQSTEETTGDQCQAFNISLERPLPNLTQKTLTCLDSIKDQEQHEKESDQIAEIELELINLSKTSSSTANDSIGEEQNEIELGTVEEIQYAPIDLAKNPNPEEIGTENEESDFAAPTSDKEITDHCLAILSNRNSKQKKKNRNYTSLKDIKSFPSEQRRAMEKYRKTLEKVPICDITKTECPFPLQ